MNSVGKKPKFFVIAHNIRSAYNVGSVFRTADALGVDRVILSGYSPTPKTNNKIAKTALGAEKFVAWEKVSSLSREIARLKEVGFQIVALEKTAGSIRLDDLQVKGSVALILGNEVRGISRQTLVKADQVVAIPMRGEKESLNVSVAFGIGGYSIKQKLNH